jgi:hypothetical protein
MRSVPSSSDRPAAAAKPPPPPPSPKPAAAAAAAPKSQPAPASPPGPPAGHFDAFGNLKELTPKHAVYEAVTTAEACTDISKTYVGGEAERHRRCVKKIRKAVQSGASINHADPSTTGGQTPLMASVIGRRPVAVKALLEMGAGADVRQADTGLTALDTAAKLGYSDVVAAMMLTTTMVDVATAIAPVDGLAPIHRACVGEDRGHAEVVELFIRHAGHKGIVRLKTAKGNTAFDETIQHGTKNIVTRKILTVRRKCHAMPLPCPRAPSIDEASQPSLLSLLFAVPGCLHVCPFLRLVLHTRSHGVRACVRV